MKIGKLMNEISNGNITNNDIIVISPHNIEIKYVYDRINNEHSFTTMTDEKIDILKYFDCDFTTLEKHIQNSNPIQDAWDALDFVANPDSYEISNDGKPIKNKYNDKQFHLNSTGQNSNQQLSGFFIPHNLEKYKDFHLIKENNYTSTKSFNPKDMLSLFTIIDNPIENFYNTAETYYEAANVLIDYYNNTKVRIGNFDTKNRNEFGWSYQEDSLIRTLLAFSCECYLKTLILQQGVKLENLPHSHGLIELYTELDDDTIGNIFISMENNGYDIEKPKFSNTYDNPSLVEKFMLEFSYVNNAFIDSRYCAEKDKNTNYKFLEFFAKALKQEYNNLRINKNKEESKII